MHQLERALGRRSTVYTASGVTLAIGLYFIFVWAPHPWGWDGFDGYHQLALTVAAGRPYPTMEYPWAYAYFLAVFYRLFGDRPWVPLVFQAALNALVPLLVYRFAVTWVDRPTATLAAVIAGVFSFNTVYASTQSSDAVCTVILMTALVAFAIAERTGDWRWFATTGALAGFAPQFRPNLILVPMVLAAYTALTNQRSSRQRLWRRLTSAATLLICAGAAIAPWVVHTYRLTGTLLPTSVHGAVQLWYGSLQVGPYLHSRSYNPRMVFETSVFDYTSLDTVPIVVSAHPMTCAGAPPLPLALVYWTDHDGRRQRLRPMHWDQGRPTFEIPAPGRPSVLYYYFDATWPRSAGRDALVQTTPVDGEAAPFVYFISQDHLDDLDVHGDLLDVFDLVRVARHVVWQERLPFETTLSTAGIAPDDLEKTADILGRAVSGNNAKGRVLSAVEHDAQQARLTFQGGSSIVIPRKWSGRITDLTFDGELAAALMRATVSLASLGRRDKQPVLDQERACAQLEEIEVNHVFYREQPHLMRRYWALALDNIRRDPLAFARASAYRAFRLFVVVGTGDRHTVQQFSRSSAVYAVATIASVTYLVMFLGGVVIAWLRGYAILLSSVMIAYMPLTISALLTNMRYSITVQPIVFVFIAVTLTAMAEKLALLGTPERAVTAAEAADLAERRRVRLP